MLRWLAYVCVHSYTCVWLCWDSWGIKRSIYPETNSAFLLVSGESDQTPGLIPYSAVPSLSKPAITHKSLAILSFPNVYLSSDFQPPNSQLLVIHSGLFVWFDRTTPVLLFWTVCVLLGCLRRQAALRCVFQSTVGHARRPLPQLALSVSPNNVSGLLRLCHPPNHHISLHNKWCVLGSKVKIVTVTAFTVRTTTILGMQLIKFSPKFSTEKTKNDMHTTWKDGLECLSVSNPDILQGQNWWKIPRHSLTIDINVQKSMTLNSTPPSLKIWTIFKWKMLSTLTNIHSKKEKQLSGSIQISTPGSKLSVITPLQTPLQVFNFSLLRVCSYFLHCNCSIVKVCLDNTLQ